MAAGAVPLGGLVNTKTTAQASPTGTLSSSGVPSTLGAQISPMQVTQNNPYVAPTVGPGTGVPGASTTPGVATQTNGVNWVSGSNTVIGDFDATYGKGTGNAITSVLQNLGTSNDSAIQALEANTNLEANNQFANIQAQQAAQGITPNSSAAGLAEGDFYSQVNSQLQSNVAGMENSQEQTLLGALTSEGSAHGGDSSFLGTLGSVLGGGGEQAIGGIANAFNETAASGTGGLSSILSAIGGLA